MKHRTGLCLSVCLVIQMSIAAIAHASTNGLVVHYDFNSDDGTNVWDQSGNGNHGYVVGAVTYEDSIDGKAPRFTSKDTYIVSDAAGMNMNGWSEATVSTWVLMKNYSTYGRVINRGNLNAAGYGGFSMQVGGVYGGVWQWGSFCTYTSVPPTTLYAASTTFAAGVTPFPPKDVWYNIVGVYDSTSCRIYVDGVLEDVVVGDMAGLPIWDDVNTKLVIGNAACTPGINWTDNYFDGLIDNVRIYSRALTSNEIAAAHTASLVEFGLVLHYTFDTDEGGVVVDQSGAGNNGTVGAAATLGVSGVMGNGVSYAGARNVTGIFVPDSDSLDTDTAFSLCAWVKPNSYTDELGGSSDIIAKWYSSPLDGDYQYGFSNSGQLQLLISHSDPSYVYDYIRSPAAISTTSWSHVAATFQDGDVRLYVNGVMVTNVTSAIDHTHSGEYGQDDVYIGGTWAQSRTFDGVLDDVRIYNRALSSGEINQMGTAYRALEVSLDGEGTVDVGNGSYANGVSVVLTATPSNGYQFAYWSGDVPNGKETDNPLALTMDQGRSVTAVFAQDGYDVPVGLVLWNTLGSANEVQNSVVGSDGVITGSVNYSPVRHGDGVALDSGTSRVYFDRPLGDTFPDAGCVEFWWKAGHDENISTGSHYAERVPIVMASDETRPAGGFPALLFHVQCGGTFAEVYNKTRMGLSIYDEVNGYNIGMSSAYNFDFKKGDLIHVAVTWDKSRAPAVLKVYYNGAEAIPDDVWGVEPERVIGVIQDRFQALHYDLELHRRSRRPDGADTQYAPDGYVDNVKIWDYAKTNFIDIARYLDISVEGEGVVDGEEGWHTNGAMVTLTPYALSGYTFSHWTGDVPSGQEEMHPLTVTMDQSRHITAVFIGDATTDLVLHYTFDSDDGTNVWDQSGNGNHGYLVGAVTYEDSIEGKAPRFTSRNTYIVSDAAGLNMDGWQECTISAWVLMKGYTTYGVIASRGEVSGGGYGGFTMQAGGVYGGSWNHGVFGVCTNTSVGATYMDWPTFAQGVTPYPDLNRWYHLVGTYDGSTLSLYVDGVLETNTILAANPLADSVNTKLVIGNSSKTPQINWSDKYFNGLIDDFRIYRRALSADEVAALHSPVAITDGKLFSYSFDVDNDPVVLDESGNGLDAIAAGTTRTTAGAAGDALLFDGSSSVVTVTNTAPNPVSDFTIAAWIKPSGAAGARPIVSKSDQSLQSRRSIEFYVSGDQLIAYFWDSSTRYFRGRVFNAPVFDGAWHHVVLQHDTSLANHQMRMYIDGEEQTLVFDYETVASIPVVRSVTAPWRVGHWAGGPAAYFDGGIDEVNVYDRVLSAAEIQAMCESEDTKPTLMITSPTVLPTYSASVASIHIAGVAADNVGITRVVVLNNRAIAESVCTGTTNWQFNGLPLHKGPNYLTVIAYDAAGNTATDTLVVSYTADPVYSSILRSGALVQEIDFADNITPGETVTVRCKLLSYVPIRLRLGTGSQSGGWSLFRNAQFVGITESPWNIGGRHAKVYSFQCNWTAPMSPGDFFVWFNAAQMDGEQYMASVIPDGVDPRPHPTLPKLIVRTIGAGGRDESPLSDSSFYDVARVFEDSDDYKMRAGAAIIAISIPDNIKVGQKVACEWKVLSYVPVYSKLALVNLAQEKLWTTVYGTLVSTSQSSWHIGTIYAKEYVFRGTMTVPENVGEQEIYFMARDKLDANASWMAGNIPALVDGRPVFYNGMYGRFIRRRIVNP